MKGWLDKKGWLSRSKYDLRTQCKLLRSKDTKKKFYANKKTAKMCFGEVSVQKRFLGNY